RRVSPSRASGFQRAPYSRRRPLLPVVEQGGASRRRREPRVGTTYWRCYGQNTQSSVISAHADHLRVGGLPEFVPRAAVDCSHWACASLDIACEQSALVGGWEVPRARDTRATGGPGDAAAAALQDQPAI